MRPFPHLAALLAAVFSTHVCSPASAQDPREKPKELDVLRNYAGATIGTPIQPTPPEVQKLDVFLGERDVEFIHRPSIVSPQGSTAKGTTSGQWTLDGRFLLGQTKLSSFESTWVMGYDANRKAYRYVLFGSNGRMEENVGQWNEAERVFEWQLVNGPPGFTRTSITRRLDDHTLESRSVTKNGEGKVQMDLTIKGTRRK
jgi:hypothetical protein